MGLFLCFLRNTLFESSALLKPVTLTSPHFSSNDLAFAFTRAWKDSRESTSSLTWKIHLPSSLRHPPSQAPQGPLSLLWPTSIYCSPNPSRWPFKWTQVSQISKPIKTKTLFQAYDFPRLQISLPSPSQPSSLRVPSTCCLCIPSPAHCSIH